MKSQRNWLKQVWMLKFWSVINCTFVHWRNLLYKPNHITSGTLHTYPNFLSGLKLPQYISTTSFSFYIRTCFLVPMVSVVPSPFKQNCLDIFSPSKRKHLLPILLWSKSDHFLYIYTKYLRSWFQNINKISKIFRPQYAPKRDFSAVFWW